MTRLQRLALLFVIFPTGVAVLKMCVLYGTPVPLAEPGALPVFLSYVAVTLAALVFAVGFSLWAEERKRQRVE